MLSWLAWLIAVVCAAAFLTLWFWEVRRIMRARKSTVESAEAQMTACSEKAAKKQGDSEAVAIMERSRNIYQQAVDLYNRMLRKPWIFLPAVLMGFRPVS